MVKLNTEKLKRDRSMFKKLFSLFSSENSKKTLTIDEITDLHEKHGISKAQVMSLSDGALDCLIAELHKESEREQEAKALAKPTLLKFLPKELVQETLKFVTTDKINTDMEYWEELAQKKEAEYVVANYIDN